MYSEYDIRDERLDRMMAIADETNTQLDDVVAAIGKIPQIFFDAVSDKPSLLPLYMKSRVSP